LTVVCSLPPPLPLVTCVAVAHDAPATAAAKAGAAHGGLHVSVAWCDVNGGLFVWRRGYTHALAHGPAEARSSCDDDDDANDDANADDVEPLDAEAAGPGDSTVRSGRGSWAASGDVATRAAVLAAAAGRYAVACAPGSEGLGDCDDRLRCGVAWADDGGDDDAARWLVAWGRHTVAVFQRTAALAGPSAAAFVLCRRVDVRRRGAGAGAVKVAAVRCGRLCVVTVDGWCFDFDLALFP
jgi:hypothetical protein